MIAFANPLWLYGLFGLLIPIGIHLLSRKEGKTIHIGSIRHLTDSDTAQFSSVRLNEIVLLILRMLLITLLVFILAGFSVKNNSDRSQQWLLIEKGVQNNKLYMPVIDSLTANGFEAHWLAEGFPMLVDSLAISSPGNYFSTVQKIPSNVDSAVVLSYSYAAKFKGENISLPSNVNWLMVEPEQIDVIIDAIKIENDSVAVRTMKSAGSGTILDYSNLSVSEFNRSKKIDSLVIKNRDTISVQIYATPKFAYDSKIIQASLQAIAETTPHHLDIKTVTEISALSKNADFVFWFSDEKLTWKDKFVIGYAPCQNNLPLIATRDKVFEFCSIPEFTWVLTQRLNEENVLRESLAYSLSKIILPKNNVIHLDAWDHRTIPATIFSESDSEVLSTSPVEENIATGEPLLAILLFIVLATERFIAHKRNQ